MDYQQTENNEFRKKREEKATFQSIRVIDPLILSIDREPFPCTS